MKKFVKRCREEAGLTQDQLAEKMGVSVVSVQNWETGKTKINQDRYWDLASIFNVPVEKLMKEMLIEEDTRRPDIWPGFLFDDSTNAIVDTLHLNLAQQDLFGLLYIYGSEYLKQTEIGVDTFEKDLKAIPYGFIDRVGSIQFLNQAEDLHKVIKYVRSDFLMKVLRQNPEVEFNVKKLPKNLIKEFIDNGFKPFDEFASFDEGYEGAVGLHFRISMKKASIILPVLESNGPVHITDGWWSNPIRTDISSEVQAAILKMCDFDPTLWEEGYYKDKYNVTHIRNGLETVTDYKNVSPKGKEECWIWQINDKGRKLLEWLQK